ncbi:hybrid sensor histidine kinase/response regulator [Pararhizobium haloflavum]|uniref:hybrid sensor histidine kinase/response regulator n=1 Tax=Pararhizobium haloflavum TaxID=2037914 RepID=UPI000C17FE2D|nr:PAS-domain containing protein [Pararhizobium haloflavum]
MTVPPSGTETREALEAEVLRLRRENEKLTTIRDALIAQVDRNNDLSGRAFNIVRPILEVEGNVEKRIQRLARAMSEAKIARRQLQQAIDSIGEGFILYDQDDRIVLCNRTYRQIFPELEKQLRPGTHFKEIIERAAKIGVIVEAVTDPEAWIASRETSHSQQRCQFQQLLSDGRWIQISEQATEEGGKVTIVSDITPFKRLEETRRLTQLASQSDVLATTIASIAQGVIVFDRDFGFVAWNSQAAMLTNLPYVDMHAGTNVRDLFRLMLRHGARIARERRRDALEWIAHVRRRPPLRLEISYPGGRTVSANFRTMPDDGFVVTLTDVSTQFEAARMLERSKEELEKRVGERTRELVRLNEVLHDEVRRHELTAADLELTRRAAEAANLSKTQFLAAASHDLLQPLNAARLYLFALESAGSASAQSGELIEGIAQALQSTEGILSTLLDISKMDTGGYQPKCTEIVLADLFDTLKIEFDALAADRGIALRIVPTSAIVHTDAHLLRRIVQNFLSNAIKYTETGSILLGVRRRGPALSIEVHDTGPGIALADRQAIFQEFKRAAPAASRASGVGLGLAIAQRAADLLHHTITLQSEVGRGSCFALQLPASGRVAGRAAGSRRKAAHQPPEPRAADTGGRQIIVLENDETVAHAMTTLLDHWQFESVLAASFPALEALLAERELSPRAIIADLHLNGAVDGIEAIIALRRMLDRDVPGILITADQSRAVRERARQAAIEYFSKPVKPAQLRAYLAHLSLGATDPVRR